MIAVLVSTHGSSAKSLVESAEMICGKQTLCEAVSFSMGQSLDDFQQQIEHQIKLLSKQCPQILCLVDLKGGTPFNTLVKQMADHQNLEVITGVNIPMLLTTFMLRTDEISLNDLLSEIIEVSVQGIERYNIASIMNNNIQDEDF